MRLFTVEARKHYRQIMIPESAQRDPRSTDKAEVFTYTNMRAQLCALGFIGTSSKPMWHWSFRNEAEREQRIADFFAGQRARDEYKAQRKAARVSYSHTLKVGDLVHTSWGYDQTNVSFYEVTRIVSSRSVCVRPIKAHQIETGFMCGQISPLPDEYCGPETRHLVREGNIIVHVEHGRYDGYPCGTEPQRNSWYA